MNQFARARLLGLAVVLAVVGAATVLVGSSRASASSPTRTLVALRKTALGTVLVDARGRTLYLFEKDRNGVSACNTACANYWPALVSQGAPRAGKGVRQSLLRLSPAQDGRRQVTYAGHPLYTFIGDKRAGQTTGEGLNNFGAEWYALSASGSKVEQSQGTSGSPRSGGAYGSGGGYGS